MDLGGRIRELREQRGWTQADLAARAGVSDSYISRLEGGDYKRPSAVNLGAIATVLGVRLVDLTGQEPQARPRMTSDIVQELQAAIHREREGRWEEALLAAELAIRAQPELSVEQKQTIIAGIRAEIAKRRKE